MNLCRTRKRQTRWGGNWKIKREKLPISLTTIERDFNKDDADRNSQGLNFDNIIVLLF